MKKILAALLVVSFSMPLTMALAPADAESDLPACCRRDGKHACGMSKRATENPVPDGPVVRSRKNPCPHYPSGKATPAVTPLALLPDRLLVHAASSPSQILAAALGTLPQPAVSRAHRERGPPTSRFSQA